METVISVSFSPNTTDVFVAVKSDAVAVRSPLVQPKELEMQVMRSQDDGTAVDTVKVRSAALTLPGALLSVRVRTMLSFSLASLTSMVRFLAAGCACACSTATPMSTVRQSNASSRPLRKPGIACRPTVSRDIASSSILPVGQRISRCRQP